MRAAARDSCVYCGAAKPTPGRRSCERCRAIIAVYKRAKLALRRRLVASWVDMLGFNALCVGVVLVLVAFLKLTA